MKKDPCLKDVIVIALTALDDRETRKKLFNMAINDFITKPFDALELIVKTKAYLALKAMIKNSSQNSFTLKEEVVEDKIEPLIIIKDDKDIMAFWKCIRNHETVFEHKLDINTFMSLLYAFYMKYRVGFKIYLSKYDNELHFAIRNKTLASYVLNNEVVNKYEIDIDNVIFKINIKADLEHVVYECEDAFRVFEKIIYEN
jgi:CheY-like chemotaxis protein